MLLNCLSDITNVLFFLPAVNQKKDSENTPVKGGTVTDLGMCSVWVVTDITDMYCQGTGNE